MIKQLIELMLTQIREFYRQPGILFWGIGFPILMAWGLGAAFTGDREMNRTIAVVDRTALSPSARSLLSQLEESDPVNPTSIKGKDVSVLGSRVIGKTSYLFVECSLKNAELLVKRGETALILMGVNETEVFHFDPNHPESKLAYLELRSSFENRELIAMAPSIKLLDRSGTRYIDFLIPGLMAMGIMMSCMWGVSYALIDKRSKYLLRRMVATPMNKSIFLLSHLGVRIILTSIEALTLFAFAALYFNIEVEGGFAALLLVFLAGNSAFFGIAILISSRTDNAQIGNGLINLITMPMMIGSGVFFSYHNFPHWMENVIRHLPLTLVADSYRSIFNEGARLPEVYPAAVVLLVLGAVTFALGKKMYKWY